MEEIWQDVPGYEGHYQASSSGEVRSLDREIWMNRGKGYFAKVKGRVLKKNFCWGYYVVCLQLNGTCIGRYVHSIIAQTFVGERPEGMQVRHFDGNKLNNVIENISYCTPQENTDDKKRHGTIPCGVDHQNSKLNPRLVEYAFELNKRGLNPRQIGEELGVHGGTIRNALIGKTWKVNYANGSNQRA